MAVVPGSKAQSFLDDRAAVIVGNLVDNEIQDALGTQEARQAILQNLGVNQDDIIAAINKKALESKIPLKTGFSQSLGRSIMTHSVPALTGLGTIAGIYAAKSAASRDDAVKRTLTKFVNPTVATFGTLGALGLASLLGGAGYLGYKALTKESSDKTISLALAKRLRLA